MDGKFQKKGQKCRVEVGEKGVTLTFKLLKSSPQTQVQLLCCFYSGIFIGTSKAACCSRNKFYSFRNSQDHQPFVYYL